MAIAPIRDAIARRAARLAGPASVVAAGAALVDAGVLYADRDNYIVEDQNLTFPTDLSDAYMHMRFSEYKRRSINQQPFYDPQNSIKLPIPSQLRDSTTLNYSPVDLGPAYGAAAEAVSSAGSQGSARGELGNAITQLFNVPAGIGAQTLQTALNAAPGPRGAGLNAISAVTGLTFNPYQTITFKTPEFKTHSFSWKLVPNNENESNIIERILRIFKYHSSPALSPTGAFFAYPEILEIRIFPNDEYLYKFKPCVVKSINVNYAPMGPSFYRGSRAPTGVEFSIQLQEIELWTKTDYVRDPRGYPQPVTGTTAGRRAAMMGGTTVRPNLTPAPRS